MAFPEVLKMEETNVVGLNSAGQKPAQSCRNEIEQAIDDVKRTEFSKWFRKEWYKAGARNRWPEQRLATWRSWKKRR